MVELELTAEQSFYVEILLPELLSKLGDQQLVSLLKTKLQEKALRTIQIFWVRQQTSLLDQSMPLELLSFNGPEPSFDAIFGADPDMEQVKKMLVLVERLCLMEGSYLNQLICQKIEKADPGKKMNLDEK